MSMLRNIYLQWVRNYACDYDYTIVWDMDVIGSIYLDGIASSIYYLSTSNATGMCANGLYRWGLLTLYYDTYACLHPGEKFYLRDKTYHDIKKGLGMRYDYNHPPVKMDSCFGGFTIYKTNALLNDNIKHEYQEGDNIECEHVILHRNIRKYSHDPEDSRLYHNPRMINFILLND